MNRPIRRGTTALTSLLVAAAGVVALGTSTTATAAAAPLGTTAPSKAAADTPVTDATFTWGLNGYAQKGIFGPWTYKDLTGNTTQLVGSVSDPLAVQNEYVVQPVPATSMPASTPQKTPNAIRFSEGTGSADPETGAAEISWTGSYTVNAYPAQFNAPNEIYSDPQLDVAADGSGELTMNFALGAGTDMGGNPTPAEDFGRVSMMTFSAGSDAATGAGSFRYTPDYQGVSVEVPADGTAQTTACSTSNGATGWWGSWPQELISDLPASVRPHFYSTGCGGMQDNKPPLPVDVDLNLAPSIEVTQTDFLPTGEQEITVTGTNFDPTKAIGTRPPLSGQPAGAYVVFGVFADDWKPSTGATSSSRKVVTQEWATPEGTFGPDIADDGSFTTTLVVSKAAADTAAAGFDGNYGIYSYPGSGAVEPSFETYTPVTFTKGDSQVTVTAPAKRYGNTAAAAVAVAADDATGTVTLKQGSRTVGTTDLAAEDDGVAVFSLGALKAGSYPLTASFAGNDTSAAGAADATLVVKKAAANTKATVAKKPTTKKSGTLKVAVGSPTTTPNGKVEVTVKNAKGKTVKSVTVKLRNGAGSTGLPKGATGRYRVTVAYPGSPNVASDSGTASYRIG